MSKNQENEYELKDEGIENYYSFYKEIGENLNYLKSKINKIRDNQNLSENIIRDLSSKMYDLINYYNHFNITQYLKYVKKLENINELVQKKGEDEIAKRLNIILKNFETFPESMGYELVIPHKGDIYDETHMSSFDEIESNKKYEVLSVSSIGYYYTNYRGERNLNMPAMVTVNEKLKNDVQEIYNENINDDKLGEEENIDLSNDNEQENVGDNANLEI